LWPGHTNLWGLFVKRPPTVPRVLHVPASRICQQYTGSLVDHNVAEFNAERSTVPLRDGRRLDVDEPRRATLPARDVNPQRSSTTVVTGRQHRRRTTEAECPSHACLPAATAAQCPDLVGHVDDQLLDVVGRLDRRCLIVYTHQQLLQTSFMYCYTIINLIQKWVISQVIRPGA